MIQLMISLILFIPSLFTLFPDCNVSSIEGLVCDEEIQIYHTFLPIVQGGNVPPPPPPVVRWTDGLLEHQVEEFCNETQPECQEWPGIPFEYEAPSGYVVSFVRLFGYGWGMGGAYFIYPYEGCVMKVCVVSLNGSIAGKTSTKIKIYIDEDLDGWGGPINLIDICHEKEGYPYIKVCDSSYTNKYPTFQADFK